jgi:hypothetical protein
MTTSLKGLDAKGTYEIGVDDGWVVSGKTVQTMTLSLNVDAPGLSAGAASLDFTTSTTTTVKRLSNDAKEVNKP